MDCSPPGSSVRGLIQARILECVAMPFSRGSSQPRDRTQVSHNAGRLSTEPPGKPFVDDSLASKMCSFRALSRYFGIQEWVWGEEIQILRQNFQRVKFFKIRLVI